MKKVLYILAIVILALPGCKAKHSFKSREGKKKLKYYNSVQYGHTKYPKAKKSTKKSPH